MIDDADIYKILISDKVCSGKKGCKKIIDHKDDDYKIKPLRSQKLGNKQKV